MQKALKAGVVADAVAPAKTASAAFADIEKFWAAQKKDDAVKLAASARMGFADAAAAAAKGDLMAAQMAAGNATAQLQAVPLGLYREGDPQTGFKFKAGSCQRVEHHGSSVTASADPPLQHPSRLPEYALHHRRRQLAGVRVLPARVIAAEQCMRSARTIASSSRRHRDRTADADATRTPRRRSSCSHASNAILPSATTTRARGSVVDLRVEMIEAARDLLRQRLVVGRRAAHRGEDVRVRSAQAVVDVSGRRDVGEAGAMQRRHQEVAGAADAVAGEHAAGAVGAVRRGRQADEQQPRVGIAEARHRAAPVGLVRYARFFSCATVRQYARSRGQRSHDTIA